MNYRYLTGGLAGTFLLLGQCLAGSSAFDDALRAAGWEVAHETDGSLILRRGAPSAAPPARSASKATGVDRWAPLRARGWRVVEAADGTVTLYPPSTAETTTSITGGSRGRSELAVPGGKPTRSSASRGLHTDALIEAMRTAGWEARRSADGGVIFRRAVAPAKASRWAPLRAQGWRVIEAADGSVKLYPPGRAKATNPPATQVQEPVPGSEVPCSGVVVDSRISLPANTWAKAHRLALAWLRHRGESGLILGRIRHVLRVYLVSIVEKRPPHRLRHQLVIRRRDGRVILVD